MASDRPLDGPSSPPRAPAHDGATPDADAPPLAPQPDPSPWWTAPAGRPVAIPAFGRDLIDALGALLLPAPRLMPLRIKARARR